MNVCKRNRFKYNNYLSFLHIQLNVLYYYYKIKYCIIFELYLDYIIYKGYLASWYESSPQILLCILQLLFCTIASGLEYPSLALPFNNCEL